MSVYEVGLLVTYILFALIVGISFVVANNKAEKNKLEWRERLIEAISMNTVSIEEVVKALMYEK